MCVIMLTHFQIVKFMNRKLIWISYKACNNPIIQCYLHTHFTFCTILINCSIFLKLGKKSMIFQIQNHLILFPIQLIPVFQRNNYIPHIMYSFKLLTTEQSNKTNFNSIKSVFTFNLLKKKNRIEKFQIFSCIYRKLICELICNKESG